MAGKARGAAMASARAALGRLLAAGRGPPPPPRPGPARAVATAAEAGGGRKARPRKGKKGKAPAADDDAEACPGWLKLQHASPLAIPADVLRFLGQAVAPGSRLHDADAGPAAAEGEGEDAEVRVRAAYDPATLRPAYWLVHCGEPAAEHALQAKDRRLMGTRNISVSRARRQDLEETDRVGKHLRIVGGRTVALSNVPFDCPVEDIDRFFEGFELVTGGAR